ncbi:MAG: hypothetical protein QOG80_1766, partial [Pseudonocardiales bacterium]|nr:hypothetical protein [Pseudonocardiales bacterium]
MQAWESPRVPELPGRGQSLSLFDTASCEIRDVVGERDADGPMTMYVCGI